MSCYLVFFGKSSEFTSFAFDAGSYLPDFERNVFKDFDQLESRFLINDQIGNSIVLSKSNFNYINKSYSMLKMYGCAMANNANRITGSSYGVAIISDLDILVSDYNTNLLLKTITKFNEIAIVNNRFSKTNFLEYAQKLWKVFVAQDYFSKIERSSEPYVSLNSNSIPILCDEFIGLEKIAKDQIRNSSKLYFTSDLGHIQRSISNLGSNISIFQVSNGKLIEYREEVVEEIVKPEIKSENDIVSDQSSEESIVIETNDNHKIELENKIQEINTLELALLNERELVSSLRSRRFLIVFLSLALLLSLIAGFFVFQNKVSKLENQVFNLNSIKKVKKSSSNLNDQIIVPSGIKLDAKSIANPQILSLAEFNSKVIKDLELIKLTDSTNKLISKKNIYCIKVRNQNSFYFIIEGNKMIRMLSEKEIENFKL